VYHSDITVTIGQFLIIYLYHPYLILLIINFLSGGLK
jgi:hypothetical protein